MDDGTTPRSHKQSSRKGYRKTNSAGSRYSIRLTPANFTAPYKVSTWSKSPRMNGEWSTSIFKSALSSEPPRSLPLLLLIMTFRFYFSGLYQYRWSTLPQSPYTVVIVARLVLCRVLREASQLIGSSSEDFRAAVIRRKSDPA